MIERFGKRSQHIPIPLCLPQGLILCQTLCDPENKSVFEEFVTPKQRDFGRESKNWRLSSLKSLRCATIRHLGPLVGCELNTTSGPLAWSSGEDMVSMIQHCKECSRY